MFAVAAALAAPPRRLSGAHIAYASPSVNLMMRKLLRPVMRQPVVRSTGSEAAIDAVRSGAAARSWSCYKQYGFCWNPSHALQPSNEASGDRPTTLPALPLTGEVDDRAKRTPAYPSQKPHPSDCNSKQSFKHCNICNRNSTARCRSSICST